MIRNLWPLLIGFAIWAVAFLALYSIQALGCVWAWPPFWHRTLLIAIFAITLMALATVLFRQIRKPGTGAIGSAGAMLTLAALVASVLTFAPAMFVEMCL